VTETGGHPAHSPRSRAVFLKKGSFLAGFPAGCSSLVTAEPISGNLNNHQLHEPSFVAARSCWDRRRGGGGCQLGLPFGFDEAQDEWAGAMTKFFFSLLDIYSTQHHAF
jgi:hypothetical protein